MPTGVMEEKKVTDYQKAQKIQANYRQDPINFSQSWFNSNLWTKQEEVMFAIRDYSRVAVRSGNTVGKSRIASEIIMWFLLSHYPSKVVITAPTFLQIEQILWKEIAKLYHKSVQPIGGDLLKTELKFNEEWFAIGISTDEVNRFQGIHSPYLLVVIDEALGVDPMIWEAIEGLHPYRILAIGNPLVPEGNFFNCFSSAQWHKIGISCQECVDWQNKNGAIPGLVTRQWIDERKEDWGERSPLYQARVLGEFPQEGMDVLIPMKWVDKAREIEIDEEEDAIKVVGSDVATKHGNAQTVIGYRVGHTIYELNPYSGFPAPMTANKIQQTYSTKQADTIVIDSDGFGEGISDILTGRRIGVVEFHGGYASKAMDSIRFRNLRSQFYWVVAKKFEKELYSLKHLPKHIFEKLKSQLCSIRVKSVDGQGRFQIETKEDMLARGLYSPDFADCFVYMEYGFWQGKQGDIKEYRYR